MDDPVGIDVSKSGWDSEMIAYPAVYHYRDAHRLICNGYRFDASGFGIAPLEP